MDQEQLYQIRTRNFRLSEIIHRPFDFDFDDPELVSIALIALGYTQALRDALWEFTGREIPISIGSGYRSPKYNKSLKNAAANSYHMWRWATQGGVRYPVWALDIKPVGYDLNKFYNFVKDRVRGETYIHRGYGFVHVAPFGPDEEW